MPSPSQLRNLEAIRRSSVHQSMATASSSIAMVRYRAAAVTDPAKALDLVRSLVQKEITEKIGAVMSSYVDEFFGPAIENARRNSDVIACGGGAGANDVINADLLLEEVCVNALEAAKSKYRKTTALTTQSGTVVHLPSNPSLTIEPTVLSINRGVKRKATSTTSGYSTAPPDEKVANLMTSSPVVRHIMPQQPTNLTSRPAQSQTSTSSHPPLIQRSNSSDLILITKQGKPVRREGPSWEPGRLSADTTFILGSKANKALGLGQTRGRLYMKHPELFKYSGDSEDKEWLTKNHVMSTTGGKAYLMVLQDIVALSGTDEYSSSPKLQPSELQGGFQVPAFMLTKMRTFMGAVRTDPGASDDVLLLAALARTEHRDSTASSTSSSSSLTNGTACSRKTSKGGVGGSCNPVRDGESASPNLANVAAPLYVSAAASESYVGGANQPEGPRDEGSLEESSGGGGNLDDEECEHVEHEACGGQEGGETEDGGGGTGGGGGNATACTSDLFIHGDRKSVV